MINTLCFHCRGHKFNSRMGTKVLQAMGCSQKKKKPEKQASLSTALKELTWCLGKGLKLLNSHVKQPDYQYLLLLLLLLTTTTTNNYSHKTKNVLDFLHQ